MARKIDAQKIAQVLAELNQDRRLRFIVHDNSISPGLAGWGAEAFATFAGKGEDGTLEIAVGRIAWMPPTTKRAATAVNFVERTLPFTIIYQPQFAEGSMVGLALMAQVKAANEDDALRMFWSGHTNYEGDLAPMIIAVAPGYLDDRRQTVDGEPDEEPEDDDLRLH